jgi:hypothetical protein
MHSRSFAPIWRNVSVSAGNYALQIANIDCTASVGMYHTDKCMAACSNTMLFRAVVVVGVVVVVDSPVQSQQRRANANSDSVCCTTLGDLLNINCG